MSQHESHVNKELFLEKIEKLSLTVEKLTQDVSNIKNTLEKLSNTDKGFGIEAIHKSCLLDFPKDIHGLYSSSKKYLISIRLINEWKEQKNDYLLIVRQQDKENNQDLKALGIRIPVEDIKTLSQLAREIISLLYIACDLKGIEINEVLRDILQYINSNGLKMVNEIKQKTHT